ncbi:TPA: hypothetical protein ACGNA4_000119 [Streptococcus agalactiae]
MKQEMININANLVAEPTFSSFEKEGKTYKNFVVKSYNKIEKKEENEEE